MNLTLKNIGDGMVFIDGNNTERVGTIISMEILITENQAIKHIKYLLNVKGEDIAFMSIVRDIH